jgi:cytochrome c biogenesis protein CcmG/thiol:disulfide interchange protein DsbE
MEPGISRTRRRRWLLPALGWILVIGFLTYRMSPGLSGRFGAGSVGTMMPAFAAKTIDGATLNREGLLGKVVLVNFWASWCGPCTVEMPAFQRVYFEQRDSGLVVIGVWTNDADAFGMRDQLRSGGITYPIVVGTTELVNAFGGVNGLPVSVLIDRSGRIRKRVFGIFHEEEFRAAATGLLREPSAAR